MKSNNDGRKIVLIIFFVMGGFFLMPIIIITMIDGYSGFFLIPILMFLGMAGVFFFIFSIAQKSIKKQASFTRDGYQTDDRHCIHCHEQISTTDVYCPHCGTEQTNYIICDYCGHKNNKHNLQCEKCNALIK